MASFLVNTLLFLCLIHVPRFSSANILGTPIRWVSATASEAAFLELDPVGRESSFFSGLCRAWFNNYWVVGKLAFGQELTTCNYATEGSSYGAIDFQVLLSPAGSTSWIPHESGSPIPEGAVRGGSNSQGEPTYVCRHWLAQEYIAPGHFSNGECTFEFWGGLFSRSYEVELLIINSYGKSIGASVQN